MSGKKQKTKKEPGRSLEVREPQATVTMLDYEGSPVVTYSVVDKRAKPSGEARRDPRTQHPRRRRGARRLGSACRFGAQPAIRRRCGASRSRSDKGSPAQAAERSNWVSIGGGKDRGWFHGTGGDGEKFAPRGAAKAAAASVAAARTSNVKLIPRDGQFLG